MNYDEMSMEELEAVNQELTAQRDALKAEARLVADAMTRRTAETEARRKLENMSDAEKAALAQMIQTESIEARDVFGNPRAQG